MPLASGVDLGLQIANNSCVRGGVRGTVPKGQDAILSVGELYFTGATASVATALSDFQLGCTNVGTGSYKIFYPRTRSAHFFPSVEGASGSEVFCTLNNVQGRSGTANLNFYGLTTATGTATGAVKIAVRPPNGTIVKLLSMFEPNGKYLF